MNLLKGIGAILAGIVFIVVTHSVTDLILEKLGIFPPPSQGLHTTWMVVTATIYRCVYTVGGGYVTASLAPEPRMRYVLILGIIGARYEYAGSDCDDSHETGARLVSDRVSRNRATLRVAGWKTKQSATRRNATCLEASPPASFDGA